MNTSAWHRAIVLIAAAAVTYLQFELVALIGHPRLPDAGVIAVAKASASTR
jgi:hypothetical protein